MHRRGMTGCRRCVSSSLAVVRLCRQVPTPRHGAWRVHTRSMGPACSLFLPKDFVSNALCLLNMSCSYDDTLVDLQMLLNDSNARHSVNQSFFLDAISSNMASISNSSDCTSKVLRTLSALKLRMQLRSASEEMRFESRPYPVSEVAWATA